MALSCPQSSPWCVAGLALFWALLGTAGGGTATHPRSLHAGGGLRHSETELRGAAGPGRASLGKEWRGVDISV